jgi:hypothetical protein
MTTILLILQFVVEEFGLLCIEDLAAWMKTF